jgi:hypothetical protein
LDRTGYTEVVLTGSGAYDVEIKGAVAGVSTGRYLLLPILNQIRGYKFNTGTKMFNSVQQLSFAPGALNIIAVTSIIRVPDSNFLYISAQVDDSTVLNKMHILVAEINTVSN